LRQAAQILKSLELDDSPDAQAAKRSAFQMQQQAAQTLSQLGAMMGAGAGPAPPQGAPSSPTPEIVAAVQAAKAAGKSKEQTIAEISTAFGIPIATVASWM
jgi:hypothetical protein